MVLGTTTSTSVPANYYITISSRDMSISDSANGYKQKSVILDEMQRRDVQEEEKRNVQREAERLEIKERAHQLLKDSLSLDDYQALMNQGYMEIPSKLYSGRRYHVSNSGFLQIFDPSMKMHQPVAVCINAQEQHLPTDDVILAKLMMLKHDEKRLYEIWPNLVR